jgi:putative membrane protein
MKGTKFGAWKASATIFALTLAQAVWAQETTAPRPPGRDLVTNIVNTLIFGLIGLVLAVVGFKVFDLIIKHDIEKEIFDNKNMAAAVLSGFVVLGICIIIAATISAP